MDSHMESLAQSKSHRVHGSTRLYFKHSEGKENGEGSEIWRQPGLQNETLSQKANKTESDIK